MATWTRIGENLARRDGGMIYLRARVGGRVRTVSLGTADARIARQKASVLLESMRRGGGGHEGLAGALERVVARLEAAPHLRPASRAYYAEIAAVLRRTLPLDRPARDFGPAEAADWWAVVAGMLSPGRCNAALSLARRMAQDLVAAGAWLDDPFAGLRRLRAAQRADALPTRAVVTGIVEDLLQRAPRAGAWVGLLAYAGCRAGQAAALRWEDISTDWIEFRAGVSGTKGAATRRLPINPALRAVLERIGRQESGPVLQGGPPREALRAACRRAGCQPLRIHDLRHCFASWAIESGVDVPTVARWLGHKDGGALLMRTYSHLRDDHSLAEAQRLKP